MQKQGKSIKTKVATGYLLLTALLILSVWFVYSEMKGLSEPDSYEAELNIKRRMTNNTLAKLFRAELIGQSLSMGSLNDYPLYRKAMREALASFDSLKTFAYDSVQIRRIDSISQFIDRKEQNMLGLLKAINDTAATGIYRRNIENIISEQNALLKEERVKKKVVVHQNSYQIKKNKKGFFKRVAEVFAPGKQDTATITNTSHEFITDTLTQDYNPADTVAGILKNIQVEINHKQKQRKEILKNKADRLRYDGQVIMAKTNRILRDFEEEELLRSIYRLEQTRSARQHSIQTISGIAISSAILAAFFLFLTWREISHSNHYRRELEIAKQKAEDLLVSREKLMLTITHDIKAPVGSIIGYTDLLSNLIKEKQPLSYLHNMKSSSEHLIKLISSLLDFHKLDSNKMEINRKTFNPYQLFDQIKESFEPLAAKKNLKLKYQIAPELNNHYISDPFRIRQITDNLLSNAIKFTSQGEVGLYVSIEQSILCIKVNDTGKGISEEDKEKMFHEFTRLKNAQGEEGFGLGLSITQKLATLLEGNIRVESIINKGTVFTVHIPIYIFHGEIGKKNIEKNSYPFMKKALHAILIDDDRIQLDLTAAMFRQEGIQVTTCLHPDELFNLLEQEAFDILLTDVQMPALNGFELLRKLRSSNLPQTTTLPVIAVTARNDMSEKDFVSMGFAGCLHKPYSIHEVNRILSTLKLFTKTTSHYFPTDAPSVLNFYSLTAFSEDDMEAANEILRTFVTETNKNINQFQKSLEDQDANTMTALAHKVLPIFHMLNAEECITPLAWLESNRGEPYSIQMHEEALFAIEAMKKVVEQAVKLF